MANKIDYTEEIRELLSSFYEPTDPNNKEADRVLHKSLSKIYHDVTNVLPEKWVYQEDVYRVLHEMGFRPYPVTDEETGESTFLYYLLPK